MSGMVEFNVGAAVKCRCCVSLAVEVAAAGGCTALQLPAPGPRALLQRQVTGGNRTEIGESDRSKALDPARRCPTRRQSGTAEEIPRHGQRWPGPCTQQSRKNPVGSTFGVENRKSKVEVDAAAVVIASSTPHPHRWRSTPPDRSCRPSARPCDNVGQHRNRCCDRRRRGHCRRRRPVCRRRPWRTNAPDGRTRPSG